MCGVCGVCACVAHRDGAALAAERDDGVVGAGPAGRGVDDDEDLLVLDEGEGLRGEHGVDVDLPEDLLEAVEGEARELGLDEVRAVLHHDLELAVALGALPLRDEVEHVHLRKKQRDNQRWWSFGSIQTTSIPIHADSKQ